MTKVPEMDGIPTELQSIITRLLEKEPTSRYDDSRIVMEELTYALDIAAPKETLMIRESFLQSARFVGRSQEVQQLDQALHNVREYKGAMYLIGGESGVGKSRLLNEVRIRALVQRTLVVRGQARPEGAAPYQIWVDILRWLCLITPVSDASARILSEVVPDLDQLLDREIETSQTVPGNARDRLQETILAQFNILEEPTVIILEDLQWAGEESIALLQGIAQGIETYPLLILGSYRSDEVPELPERIPEATPQTLTRFDENDISNLGQSILGSDADNESLIAFLQEESSGNVFFVIELLRAMAEDVPNLRDIAAQPIPDELVAGGMIAILQRRLARIPEEYRDALHYAALIGRELDQALLMQLLPDLNTETFAQIASDLSILEPQEESWRFVHDKLREEVIRSLQQETSEYQSQHREIASAIEVVYSEQDAYVPRLAHHWYEANVPDKAVTYLEQAGTMMNFWDYKRAVSYMEKAIDLDEQLGAAPTERQVRRYSVLTNAYFGQGENTKAFDGYQRLLKHLGTNPLPDAGIGVAGRLLKEVSVQLRNRLFSKRFVGKRKNTLVDPHTYFALINISPVLTYQGKPLHSMIASFVALNLVEELETSETISPGVQYAGLGYFSGLMGLHPVARTYLKLSREIGEQSSEWDRLVAAGIAGLYDLHQGRLDIAEEAFRGVIPVFEEMGNYHSLGEAQQMLAMTQKLQGRLDQAAILTRQAYQKAKERNDLSLEFSLYTTLAHMVMQQHGFEPDAFDDLVLLFDDDEMENRFNTVFDTNKAQQAYYHMLRGLAHMHIEQPEEALHHLQLSLQALENTELQRFFTYADLYIGLVRLCEMLHQSNSGDPSLHAHYQSANKLLMRYAKNFVPAQSAAALHAGWYTHYTGGTDAHKNMEQALSHAQTYRQPYDEMIAQIGIAVATGEPSGTAAQRAQELSLQLEAPDSIRRLNL